MSQFFWASLLDFCIGDARFMVIRRSRYPGNMYGYIVDLLILYHLTLHFYHTLHSTFLYST